MAPGGMSESSGKLGVRIGIVVAVLVALLLAALAVVPIALDSMATSEARARLQARGITCDDNFAVDVTMSLDLATLSPTTCTMESGPLASFEVITPLEVELISQEPVMLRCEQLRISLRQSAPDAGGSWGPLLDALAVPARIGALAHGVSDLAQRDLPPAAISQVEIVQEGAAMSVLRDVQVAGGSPFTLSAASVSLPPIAAPLGARADMSIEALRASGSADAVQLSGELEVDATLPLLGAQHQRRHFEVRARGLQGAAPTWELQL